MSISLRSFFIFLALTRTVKDSFLSDAFPLQGCKTDDLDLLIMVDDVVYYPSRRMFLSELLGYFLPPDPPDEVLLTKHKVASAIATLSDGPSLFSFPTENTTYNLATTLLDKPSLQMSFQTYTTTDDVEKQLSLVPVQNNPSFYVNDTFDYYYCSSPDLLQGLRQNSTDVAAVIVGYMWSHGIDKKYDDNSLYARSCRFKVFLILVGHDIKDKVLHHTAQDNNEFYLPSLGTNTFQNDLCSTCRSRSWSSVDLRLILEGSCYFLHVFESPVSSFQAAGTCGGILNHKVDLTSVETQIEHTFLGFLLNNYAEKENMEEVAVMGSTDISIYLGKIYIGLVRNSAITGSPFQWMNGNPLIYSNWINKLPDGGPIQRCGLWGFSRGIEWSESPEKTSYNASSLDLESDYNGWEDVGCGSRVTNMALCEQEYLGIYLPYKKYLKVSVAEANSVTQAVSRGEFTIFQDKIISVPAFVRDSQYASFFEESGLVFKGFHCKGEDDDTHIIPYSYVCDYIDHCELGQDESNCGYRPCELDGSCGFYSCHPTVEFTCSSGQCVPLESRCDVYADCYDGSDEEDCRFCNSATCCDGSCIPRHFVLNGEIDCAACDTNEDDESLYTDEGLREFDCPFICNRSECVTPSMLNDKITQCLGPEGPLDEIWGKLETIKSCKISYEFNGSIVEFVRWSPRCVYIKDRYDTVIGCRDMSHLHDCQNFTCPEGYVKCPNSYCIPLHLVHDGNNDCLMGEDETLDLEAGCTGNFECWGGKVCVHPDLICDGYPHCPSGDDELNCHVSCAEGFQCIGGTVTVTAYDKSKPLQDLTFIDKRTRYLDLSGVNLSAKIYITGKVQFQNVVELYLSHCQISYLDVNDTDFRYSLSKVGVADFSHNLISGLDHMLIIKSLPSVRVLNLSYNKLMPSLSRYAFRMLNEPDIPSDSRIEKLDLAFTSVSVLNGDIFESLPKLKHLNLSHTHISIIDQQSFFQGLFLESLDLRHMPLFNIEPNALTSLSVSKDLYSDLYKLCCPQVRGQGIPEHVCHAPASAISSCIDLIQEPAQRVLLWTVGVLAVTGNLVVITYRLLWDRAVLKKSYGLFVTNLSVSDLFMGVYLLIIAGTDVIYRDNYVWYESDWRHSTLCQTAGFLSTLSSETSAFFILLVTIDRFLVIRFPFGQFRFTRWSIILSCVIAWSVGFVLALVPTLPRFQHWQMYSSNGMCLGLPLTPDRRSGWEYSAALFIGWNFILFLLIACGQYLIYTALSENRLKTPSVVQSNSKRVQEIMVAKQLSLVVVSDFLCWFPIGIMGLLAMSGRDIGTEVYAWSAVLVLPINSALNPVLYTVPVIMKKWEDFKYGNRKSKTEMTKTVKSTDST